MIQPINSGSVNTSIFYINDLHGKTINMERVYCASNAFDNRSKKAPATDTLKLSSGDIMLGEDIDINKAAILFQNFIKINAAAVGNHEHDIQANADKVLKYVNYNLLSNNVKINPRNPWSKVIKSSVIEEVNGHKYGIIGTTPVDLFSRVKQGILRRDMTVDSAQETLKDIQTEIDNLKSQGVNKIILLSHLGNTADKIIAVNTSGLDVIMGGHSHDLIFDVKEGENLFYNKNGEPVIITQAGKDGKNFGILNLEFDKNGIIKKVQNNIGYTKDFHRNMAVKYIFDKLFENNKVFGTIKSAPPEPENYIISRNPHGYFVADCMRKNLGADIALIQSANMRGYFEEGKVDERILNDILPFKNKLYKVNYSEKDIVDALKHSIKSFNDPAGKPGIFYTSGLKYTASKNGQLINASFIDKNGNDIPINVNAPRVNKFYSTIINDYCYQGNDGFKMLYRPQLLEKMYDIDASVCVQNELLKEKKPIELKDDGRINII